MFDFIHRYEWKIEFSKEGQDHSLDFVKGICILLVVMNHSIDNATCQATLFWLWGFPAVPLFLLIQVYHSYKKGFNGIPLRLGKIWKRVVFPFLLMEILLFTYGIVLYPVKSLHSLLMASVYWGGGGPGSYYPWVYIQFAILLPLLRPLFRHLGEKTLLLLFLGLSMGSELACHYTNMPDWIYRLLFLRYIFLIYLGYRMVVKGIVLNIVTISLSIISIIAVYYFEIKEVDLSPLFYNSKFWPTCHWICYFYIAYPMLYLLCKLFYWLPANGKIENLFCRIGNHSYAIYIFQLFYFVVVAPTIRGFLLSLQQPTLALVLYLLISIFVCVFPVLRFVRGLSDSAILRKVVVGILLISSLIMLVGWKWRPFYMPPTSIKPFPVTQHDDDTLRVIMIGDSWVYFHETLRRDSTFEAELKRVLKTQKVKVVAKGKGGTASGEIYQRMSTERAMAMDHDLNYCAQSVIEAGADYCVISAGINDVRQRRGKFYYVNNYLRIVRLLLSYGIRPVIMEIPNVEVDEALIGNSFYFRLKSRICMSLLNTELYGAGDYRNTLKDSLLSTHLMDSVVYVSASSWNPDGWRDKRDLYTDDHLHLNLLGYAVLDSAFAAEIVKDYSQRGKRVDLKE
jgi:Predicted acyltransferases